MSVRTSDEGTADRQLNPDAIADRTTVGLLFRQAARYKDRPLAHYPVGKVWETATWADVQRCVLAVASALVEAGVRAGDHVVLIGPNSLSWLYCDFGIQAAGAIAVPIYSGTVPEVAQTIVENCEAVMAIASDSNMASKLRPNQTLKSIVTMDLEVQGWLAQPARRLGDVVERLEAIKPDDVCTIVYTSGTTGDPKGAELAHRNLVDVTRAVIKVHPIGGADYTLSWLP
ncbi:MAG TPA: AMP-binding protein, partial [Candidatus Dormibacteraeota bacterium]